MRIAILGASGFVGSAVASAAKAAGHDVVAVPAPRIRSSARGTQPVIRAADALAADALGAGAPAPAGPDAETPLAGAPEDGGTTAAAPRDHHAELLKDLTGAEAVINAAGLAAPGSAMTDQLVGANAVLPALVARAAAGAGATRVVHISSAAVHGDAPVLDPAADPRPNSPYGFAKRWGEQAFNDAGAGIEAVVYRPTSVHGPRREVTDMLRRLARSPLASVAAPGDDPTPQVMVDQVAALALELATTAQVPTAPVIHPWEGWTTSSFLQHLAGGKRPLQIPRPLARAVLATAKTAGRLHPRAAAQARRLEMLWFGQRQAPA